MKRSIQSVFRDAALWAGLVAAALAPNVAGAIEYSFYTNFDSSLPAEFTSVVGFTREDIQTTHSPNYTNYLPFTAGSWLRTTTNNGTQSATLTLTNLPEHDLLDLKFLLGAMDSIDSSDGPFVVKVDGVTVYSRNFGAGGSWNPGEPILIVRQTQLGYNTSTADSWWTEGGYNMGLVPELQNIPHTGSTAVIEFSSGLSTPGFDESYAIDNVYAIFRKTPYYQADFNAGLPAEFTSTTGFSVEAVTSRPRPDADFLDYGFSGNWLRTLSNSGSQSATLTLTGLPAHTHVNLDFLLAALDSIDSDDGPFTVTVDGEVIFSRNLGTGGNNFNPGEPIALVRGVQLGGNLADETWLVDGAFRMGLLPEFNNIAHTADTLTIVFSSGLNSPGSDESYAIDNLVIVLGVPEPSACVSLLMLAIMATVRRRR